MRNLKRALSLLLSSTMVLGMLVMGSSAVGYQDVDASNDHQEAIEVLQQVGIMTGDANGDFNPDGSITRNEMAVVMAHLLNLDYDYYRGVNTFTDVPEWAAPYVAACVAEGVTAGIGNNLYGGDQPITAAQGSLMIMKALGYFQNQEDFGGDWQVATIRQASYINLFDRVNSDADSALTRAQVAQLVLNGLKSNMVTFTGDKGVQVGDVTVGYHAEYTPVTNAASKYNTIVTGTTTIIGDNGQYYVQLGEELYDGKLKLANGSDDFMRPSRVWSYEGKEIGTYAKKELMVESYTTGVTGKTMYELLTATTIKDYDIYSYVDGGKGNITEANLTRSNQSNLSKTGNGVLTEVYVDNNAKEITFVSINTWLAQATSDYNSNTESATLKIYDNYSASLVTSSTTQTVDVEDVAAVEGLTKDQFVLVNQSIKDRTKLQVVAVSDPKILQDCTVTAFSKNNEDDRDANGAAAKGLYQSVTTGGEKYDGAEKAYYDASVLNEYDADLLKNNSYNVYLDQYGYVIGVDLFEGTKNYVFITGYNCEANSNISIKNADAAAIFTDGTMKQITVDVQATNKNIQAVNTKSDYAPYFDSSRSNQGDNLWVAGGEPNDNKWYTYTVDDAGVYTLKPVEQQSTTKLSDIPSYDGTTGTIDCSKVYLADSGRGSGYAYGDDDSVYIVVSQGAVDTTNDKAITDVDGVYTGVQDVKIEIDRTKIKTDSATNLAGNQYAVNPVYTVYDGDGYVIASIVLGEAQGATKNYAYILSGATGEKVEDGVTYWNFDAVMGGKKVQLTIQDKFGNTVQNLKPYSVQELVFDGDYVTKIKDVTSQINCSLEQIDAGNDDIYDIAFDTTSAGTGTTINDYASTAYLQNVNAGTVGTDNTTINLNIRTLYTTKMGIAPGPHGSSDKSEPVGLTFVKDAPAFVIQQENGKKTSTAYASVEEALGSMADANTSAPGQQFRGRIVAVLNDVGVAEWVVFISSTPVQAGSVGPITPSGMIKERPQVTMSNNVIYVPLIDMASAGATARANAVTAAAYNAMIAAGYKGYPMSLSASSPSSTKTAAGSFVAQDANGDMAFISVQYQDFNTLTVNDKVEEYVAYNTQPYTTDTMITAFGGGVGTGYTDDNGATHTPYASTGAKLSNMTAPVVIKTGYVAVPANASIDDTTTVGSTGVTAMTATGSQSTNTAVKAGSSITVEVVTTANGSATTGAKISVVLDDATAATVTDPQIMTTQEAKDGKTLTFTIGNIQKDIGSIDVEAVDYTPPTTYTVTVDKTETDLCGLTVDSIIVDKSTISSDASNKSAVVTITLSGTVNAASGNGVSLVASAASGATAYNWNGGDVATLGGQISASGAVGNDTLKFANGTILNGVQIRCTVTLTGGANAPIMITLDDYT